MKYYIIAGEASGDLHGSRLMREVYKADNEADIRFWGGDLMKQEYLTFQQEGGGMVRDYRDSAIMGFWEVLLNAKKLLDRLKYCKNDILNWSPDVVVLIDYPGFNLKIAKFAHEHGYKVFYYIAPKVWASRENRIKILKRYIDKLFIIFPFEKEYFKSKGINCIYKGNPLMDSVREYEESKQTPSTSKSEFAKIIKIPEKSKIIALIAGSREAEIKSMMPTYMDFARQMHQLPQYKDYVFLVAGAPGKSMEDYKAYIPQNQDFIKVVFGHTYSVMRYAEFALINSGTASLEACLLDCPQVVCYRISRISYLIAKILIKIKYVSLGNLILNKAAVKEFLQDDFTCDNLVKEARQILENEEYRNKIKVDYQEIRDLLDNNKGEEGQQSVAEAIAHTMISELK